MFVLMSGGLLVVTHCDNRTGYNGSAIVERSMELGEPIIFVALNYR